MSGFRTVAHRRRRPAPPRVDALLLDGDDRPALVCCRSLGRQGLTVGLADCAPAGPVPAFSSRWAASADVLPMRDDPKALVDALLARLDDRPAAVVVPAHDGTIAALRPRRDEIERRTRLALAGEAAMAVAVDKNRTLEAAAGLGIASPRTLAIDDPAKAASVLADIGYPAVIKPAQSWLGDGESPLRMRPVDVLDDREAEAAAATIAGSGGQAIAQQWVGGARQAVSLFYADGRIWAEFAQVAHRMCPVLGGCSVLRESISVPPDVGMAARRLVEEIGLEGYSEVEFRRDAAGRPLLMEINPRLSASVEVAVRAGVDFPGLLWRWAAGAPLEACSGYRTGVVMRWLPGDLGWLRENLRRPGRPDSVPPGRAIRTFARDFFRRSGYDYVDRGDLRPAAVATARMVAQVVAERRPGRR